MIATGWGEVEAAIVAHSRAGLSAAQIAPLVGWGRKAVSRVLALHGCPVNNTGGTGKRGRHSRGGIVLHAIWSDDEIAVVAGASSAAEAVRAHVAAFPDSTRGPRSIGDRWRAIRKALEVPA